MITIPYIAPSKFVGDLDKEIYNDWLTPLLVNPTIVPPAFVNDPITPAYSGPGSTKLDPFGLPEPYYGDPLSELLTINFTINPGATNHAHLVDPIGSVVRNLINTKSYSNLTNPVSWGLLPQTQIKYDAWNDWLNLTAGHHSIFANYVNIDLIKWHSKNAPTFIPYKTHNHIVNQSILPAISIMLSNAMPSIFKREKWILFSLKYIKTR